MNMHGIDWAIVVALLAFLTFMAVRTKRYTRSVADFLSANRCAGRYILCIAQEMSGMGTISFIATFEMYYTAGFVAGWWHAMAFPIWMLISVSGWIIYRFRETRALTMAQFLEVRYSKPFRVAFGLVAFLSGIIAFGIGPAVCARFFIHFCGLPASFHALGVPVSTYALVLLILLGIALLYTFTGGQISIMVTDFLQGMFCNLVFLIILVVILFLVPWHHIVEAMKSAPAHASLLNPYKTSEVKDFNMWFFVISNVWAAYMYMTWQGTQGFNSAAKTPHEAQMSKILGSWRGLIQGLLLMMLPIGVFAIMHHEHYA